MRLVGIIYSGLTLSQLNTFGINWINWPYYPISVHHLTTRLKAFIAEGGGCHSILMPKILELNGQYAHIGVMLSCLHTFGPKFHEFIFYLLTKKTLK